MVGNGATPDGIPLYGYKYLSKFVLFEASWPHRTTHISPSFCFPRGKTCESIQVVCSLLLEGSDLLISYGVNDCEAAVVRMPLVQALAFARSTKL